VSSQLESYGTLTAAFPPEVGKDVARKLFPFDIVRVAVIGVQRKKPHPHPAGKSYQTPWLTADREKASPKDIRSSPEHAQTGGLQCMSFGCE
jgi:hypothetical protein